MKHTTETDGSSRREGPRSRHFDDGGAYRIRAALSPPEAAAFALALACTRSPRRDTSAEAVERAVREIVDWQVALRVLHRHRLIGPAQRALAGHEKLVPGTVRQTLHRRAIGIARTNLAGLGETLRLNEALRAAGIEAGFLKGPVLSLHLFGDAGRRHSRDLDLMVDPADLAAAFAQLERSGYRPAGGLGADQVAEWSARINQWDFRHGVNGTLVELHWRLCPSARMAAPLGAAATWTPVDIGEGRLVNTLTGDALASYLCLHGSLHAWSRLKWLADIDELMARDADGPRRLWLHADSVGLARPAGQALWLSAALLGTPLDAETRRHLMRDRGVRSLGHLALRVMVTGGAATELEATAFGMARVRLSHFALARGFGHWRAQSLAALVSSDDLKQVQLPKRLTFAYPALRPVLWVSRRVTGCAASVLQRLGTRLVRRREP